MDTKAPLAVVLVFESSHDGEYRPVVDFLPATSFMHLLDPELTTVLDPLWVCLHLPRDVSDCRDASCSVLEQATALDIPQFVATVPLSVLRAGLPVPILTNVLFVAAPSRAVAEVEAYAKWSPVLGVVSHETMDQAFLDRCWEAVAIDCEKRGGEAIHRLSLPLTVTGPGAVERLTLLHRQRQHTSAGERVRIAGDLAPGDIIREALTLARRQRALADLEEAGCKPTDLKAKYPPAFRAAHPRWHLTTGSVGVPPMVLRAARPQVGTPRAGASASVADERRAVDILVAHRAIARGGIGMILPDVPPAAYLALRQLEEAAALDRVPPWSVTKAFRRIGHTLGSLLSKEQVAAFRTSRTTTIFSDFPWGLAVLPGDSSPLATCVPVIYRPLTPLTRALQLELTPPPATYLAEGFSVLVIEGIEDGDRIRDISEAGWRDLVQQLPTESGGRIRADLRVVSGLNELQSALRERRYDVLIVSAHGIQRGRVAGLRIGKDDVYDLGCDLPPVVFFSACAAWPRGAGLVSVVDLALRRGAHAILGTLAPITVTHHQFVARRIFLYMTESLLGREPETTLAAVVHRALASNAIVDVAHASARVRKWAWTRVDGKPSPVEEFMSRRSKGRLRGGHTYADTEAVLVELAAEHDAHHGAALQHFFQSGSYVQESLFYTLIGWPEKIVLRPRLPSEAKVRARHADMIGAVNQER